MEFGHLISKIKGSSPENPEKYLAIQIDSEFVKTAVWTIADSKTDILAFGDTTEWDGSSTEILLEAIDNSLSLALEKSTPDATQPNQVIFGLPETWATAEGIAQPRLADLRKICDKLSLKPLGFVVTTEAITHYLKSKEGTPLSAILLRMSVSEVAVSIVNLGHIEGTHVAGRSGDIAADALEGLARFGEKESLPSRMILYNGGEDLQDLSQELLAFDWQSSLPFLHLPKIEATNESFSITAVAVAGGTEVAKSLGFTMVELSPDTDATIPATSESTSLDDSATDSLKPSQDNLPDNTVDSHEDVAQSHLSAQPDFTGSVKSEETAVPDQDTATPELAPPDIQIRPSKPKPWVKVITTLSAVIKAPRFPSPPRGIGATLIITSLLLLLIAAGAVQAAKRLPKAQVRLTFSSGSLSQRLQITVDPAATSVDPENRILPAEKITIKKTGEATAETTGTKTIGDKSKGEVTIYNKTNASKKFTAGTTLVGPGSKKFLLDQDTLVASQSAQETDGQMVTTYGTATAAVTANEFGPEYNVDAGVEFSISNLSPSAFNAKNKSAFTGGTKKDTKAVSKKDQTQLSATLLGKLKDEAAAQIDSQGKGKRVFRETLNIADTEEKFNHTVGEEADSLSLTLSAEITALSVSDQEYYQLIAAALQGQIPPEFTLVSDKMETSVENVSIKDDAVVFDAVILAPLAPRINQNELLSLISGKRPPEAAAAVKSLPKFKAIEITLQPVLPSLFQWIPVDKNNIDIQLDLEE